MCPHDLMGAFEHGSCFKVATQFICQDDMTDIVNNMCLQLKSHEAENKDVVVRHHPVCNGDLYDLFGGNHVEVKGKHF